MPITFSSGFDFSKSTSLKGVVHQGSPDELNLWQEHNVPPAHHVVLKNLFTCYQSLSLENTAPWGPRGETSETTSGPTQTVHTILFKGLFNFLIFTEKKIMKPSASW